VFDTRKEFAEIEIEKEADAMEKFDKLIEQSSSETGAWE
jgi:hypothetical protein